MKPVTLALAAALGGIVGAAHAAPTLPESHAEPLAEKVACRWVGGRRSCDGRYHAYRPSPAYRGYNGPNGLYGYYGGYPSGRPEEYPTGSTAWWRAMDRDCRGGFRC